MSTTGGSLTERVPVALSRVTRSVSAVCCPNCGSAVYPLQYLTEEERLAARRKTWRESKRRHRRVFGSLKLTSAHRYWLARYTLDEVREIGSGLMMFEVAT